MHILILDGRIEKSSKDDMILDSLQEIAKGRHWSIEAISLNTRSIAPCKGCFGCWLKTPGTCIINDDAREITKKMINSDILIYLTPIVFGGYSHLLKSQIDRSIGLVHPFFKRINGEIHHRTRYRKYPSIFGIGISQLDESMIGDLFKKHIQRNAINFHSPHHATEIIPIDQDKSAIMESLSHGLANLEVHL